MDSVTHAGAASSASDSPVMFGTSSATNRSDDGGEQQWSKQFRIQQLYPAGTELFSQGSLVHEVYWLDQGLVKLVNVDEDGRERILDLRIPRQLIGAAFAFVRLPSPVSAVTVTRCRIQRMSGVEFAQRIESDDRLSRSIHQMQSQELYGQFQRMAELTAGSSRVRLEHFLSQLASVLPSPRDGRIQLPLKRRELAQLLAVTPEHLSRVLKQLCEDGIIAFEKGWLIIRDARRLASAEWRSLGDGLAANRLYA